MITTIRDLGAGYLAGKMLFRKLDADRERGRVYLANGVIKGQPITVGKVVNTFADGFATGAMFLGIMLIPNVSGPVGLVVAASDLYKHRATVAKLGRAAKADAILNYNRAKNWVGGHLPKPKLVVSNVTHINKKPRKRTVKTGATP